MKSNLAGLYIQIEAKKRRINIINLWKVPKRGRKYVVHGEGGQRWAETESTSHPNNFVILRPASFAGRRIYGLVGSSGVGGVHGSIFGPAASGSQMTGDFQGNEARRDPLVQQREAELALSQSFHDELEVHVPESTQYFLRHRKRPRFREREPGLPSPRHAPRCARRKATGLCSGKELSSVCPPEE